MTDLNRAAIMRRTLALLHHYRAGDHEAVSTILRELATPEGSAVTVAALLELVDEFLCSCDPADVDVWLQSRMLQLAQAEG